MFRCVTIVLALTILGAFQLQLPLGLLAQYNLGMLVSEHVRLKIPTEREWLGRESIGELEQCWRYVHGATAESMPRRVLVEVVWDSRENSINLEEGTITIGMGHPAAVAGMKAYLLQNAIQEMARLGLAELSRRGTLREESQFLVEGMTKVIAHEFNRSTKALSGAWVLAHFLDRMKLLNLAVQSSWFSFSGGRHDLRAAAPGITFLLTCRELQGRERTLKLFDALKKPSLNEALASAFRSSPAVLEELWLKKVREYQIPSDTTVTTEEDAPVLKQTVLVPEAARPGTTLQLRLFIQDSGNNLSPTSLFVWDEASGKIFEGRAPAERNAKFILVEIPVDEKRVPERSNYRITAVDDAGNIRHWTGSYNVQP